MSSITIAPALAQGTWSVDPSHSSVEFQVKHMGITTVKGFFSDFEGALEVAEDGTITAGGNVKAASITTRLAQRDEHLCSPDFFDAESHPEVRFRRPSSNSTSGATGSRATLRSAA